MTATTNISLISLMLNASGPVKVIMLLLLSASVASWMVIFAKRSALAQALGSTLKFENRFWSGGTLSELFEDLRRGGTAEQGIAPIFCAGYEEYTRQHTGQTSSDDTLAAVQRQMRVALTREIDRLESGLPLLATVGSTSPYVGLFGTVWGIMAAFISIGNVKQATLAAVAPGIAEALVATAMGLFAAIPAVIAYNFFTSRLDRLQTRYSTFAEEMTGIIDRGLRGVGGKS